MLILNYISFVISGFFWSTFTKLKADLVFIFEVSPMTQALPGVWYAKNKKIPALIYVQDLWPENVEIITGIKNQTFLNLIGKMVDYIYKNCTRIFVTSESFAESVIERGVSSNKVEYWPQYAEDFYKPIHKNENDFSNLNQESSFKIAFTGNVGFAQGLEILPKAAKLLSEKNIKDIKFIIVGDGRFKNDLINIIETEDVKEYFEFIPKQDAKNIPAILCSCDAAFVSLIENPVFFKTIPAKLQTYMACGMPILASAYGETEKIVLQSKSGYCSYPGDYEMLVKNILSLKKLNLDNLKSLGKDARKFYEIHFDKERLLSRMDFIFKNLLKQGE